jgi:RNA polymerase sigma-70 factor (ECF subfamily)
MFDNLVTQYSRQVLNTAMRILRDESLARDVHQDVFLAIWQRREKVESIDNWSGYLYRVTVRKAMEQAKKMRNFPTNQPIDTQVAPRSSSPDRHLLAAEMQQKLNGCICRLPKRQAEAFTLTRIEGLDYSQAASILNCTEQTVRVHLHRAIKQLATMMRPYLQEGGQA